MEKIHALLPLLTGAMEIIGHDVDEVQGLAQGGQVQACRSLRAPRGSACAGSGQRMLARLRSVLYQPHAPHRRFNIGAHTD